MQEPDKTEGKERRGEQGRGRGELKRERKRRTVIKKTRKGN